MPGERRLREIAKVVRSKNSGPFQVTFDVIFASNEDFRRVRDSGVVTRALVARLYRISENEIVTFGFFERINAIKITIPRRNPQGSIGETDMHACQQHVPLAEIAIPWTKEAA